MEIKVNWTGKYPNLCSGRWEIIASGKRISIPEPFINRSMGTEKEYQTWGFSKNWEECWESYPHGDEFEVWIAKNRGWIYESFKSAGLLEELTMEDLRVLYTEINKQDWRHNSCGGCI